METNLEMALIIGAGIGIVFFFLFAAAGFGSFEASAGHFLKDTFQGSSLEQPASSIEAAGNGLATKAHGVIVLFTGVLVIVGLMYVGSKS
jgi:hypothetical protein